MIVVPTYWTPKYHQKRAVNKIFKPQIDQRGPND